MELLCDIAFFESSHVLRCTVLLPRRSVAQPITSPSAGRLDSPSSDPACGLPPLALARRLNARRCEGQTTGGDDLSMNDDALLLVLDAAPPSTTIQSYCTDCVVFISSIRMAQFLQRWNEEFSHFNELSNKSFVHGYPVKQVSISGRTNDFQCKVYLTYFSDVDLCDLSSAGTFVH